MARECAAASDLLAKRRPCQPARAIQVPQLPNCEKQFSPCSHLFVRADVMKNEVTLSGTVDSEAVRSRAVELAMAAHVGVVVNDKMNVKPRGSKTAP